MTLKDLKVNPAEQGSMEWRVARLGKITSTRVADIMAKGRGKDDKWGKTAISMMADIAGERMLVSEVLNDPEKFQTWSDLQCRENAAMRHGKEYEPVARMLYESQMDCTVTECGMVDHPKLKNLAGSPDGLVIDGRGSIKGVIEIKCPSTTRTFMSYCWNIKDAATLKAEVPQYYWQCQNNMAVTGAKWCDLVVYCPFTVRDLYVVRIARNDDDIAAIEARAAAVEEYISEMERGVV